MVTSPVCPWGVRDGRAIRWIFGDKEPLDGLVHGFRVTIWVSSKCFQLRISFAAAGSARIAKFPPVLGSWVRVSLWQ